MEDYLTINLPICKLKNNKFNIPETCDRIWFDVGTSINSPNGVQFLKRHKNGFVVGFEPNPRMYFTIYSMYFMNQNKWLLDRTHKTAKIEKDKRINSQKRQIFNDTEEFINKDDYMKRYLLIPTAISNVSGTMDMYNNKHEGSTSLEKNWSGNNLNSTFKVNVHPLKKFIKMVPNRYEYIEHVKIDCEGHDMEVIKSCGDLIDKVAVFTVEDKNAGQFLLNTQKFDFLEAQNGGYSFINKKYKHLSDKLDYFIRV
jgi:FkbM family methyltransferase